MDKGNRIIGRKATKAGWNVHLRPLGKRAANKASRKAGKKIPE